MACGAISESLSDLNAEARSRVAHEKCEADLSTFLKNNTRSQPAGQEIVDFSYRASQPRPGAFAALENAERSHQPNPI
jgi:hypothetical protein